MIRFLLDTDHLSLSERGDPSVQRRRVPGLRIEDWSAT
jgi:hypothetical protein